jgi:hypothetical protein
VGAEDDEERQTQNCRVSGSCSEERRDEEGEMRSGDEREAQHSQLGKVHVPDFHNRRDICSMRERQRDRDRERSVRQGGVGQARGTPSSR